jgi:hypothetical protein
LNVSNEYMAQKSFISTLSLNFAKLDN